MRKSDINTLLRNILRDIEVELTDEFNNNFKRQSFFGEAWKRRKSPIRDNGRAILVDSGSLSRSLRSRVNRNGVRFEYNKDYASIHNEGGEIKVTAKMKRFFRAKFYNAQGGFPRKKGGSGRKELTDSGFYHWTKNMILSPEAKFWRLLALKPVGSVIKIPKRQFIGNHPVVEKSVRDIIKEDTEEFLRDNFGDICEEITL